jgi:hypothetical protein
MDVVLETTTPEEVTSLDDFNGSFHRLAKRRKHPLPVDVDGVAQEGGRTENGGGVGQGVETMTTSSRSSSTAVCRAESNPGRRAPLADFIGDTQDLSGTGESAPRIGGSLTPRERAEGPTGLSNDRQM